MESASPRGRLDLMYAASQGELTLAEISPALSLCLGCLACQTACPSGIRFGDMLEAQRRDEAETTPPSRLRRFLAGTLLDRPRWLRWIVAAMAAYRLLGIQFIARRSRLLWLVPPLVRLERRMPPVEWPRRWRAEARRHGLTDTASQRDTGRAAGILTGCVMDAAFGAAQIATVKVIARQGWRPVAPRAQGCCGALAMHAGEPDLARAMAKRNIASFEEALEPAGGGPVVVNSAGCGAAMKDYGAWLADDRAWKERAQKFSRRVEDVCEFLARIGLRAPDRPVPLRAGYDDPCHLLHAQRIRDQPRALLGQIPGLTLVAIPEADWCCGGAGSYTLTQPGMSAQVLQRKMAHIARAELDVVATGNPGCLLQIATGVSQRGLSLRVMHPVELIAMAYVDGPEIVNAHSSKGGGNG